MLRKPSCLTIWEALWLSHSHHYRLTLQGLKLLPPLQCLAARADGCLTPCLCHSHGQTSFPYWVDPGFPREDSQMPDSFKQFNNGIVTQNPAWASISKEESQTKESLGFYTLTVCSYLNLESLAPTVSCHLPRPQVPRPLAMEKVGSSWLLALGSSHPELNLQLTLQLQTYTECTPQHKKYQTGIVRYRHTLRSCSIPV